MGERVIPCPFCGRPGTRHVCMKMGERIVGVGQSDESQKIFFSSVSDPTNYDYSQGMGGGDGVTLVGAWEGDMVSVPPTTERLYWGKQYPSGVPKEAGPATVVANEYTSDRTVEQIIGRKISDAIPPTDQEPETYEKNWDSLKPMSIGFWLTKDNPPFPGFEAGTPPCADHWVNPISGRCKTCGGDK